MELERERLRAANRWVKERVLGKIDEEEFSSQAKKLPTLLINSGLVLTVAYLQKRWKNEDKEGAGRAKDKPEKVILDYIVDRLREKGLVGKVNSDFLNYLLEQPSDKISLMFDEALASAEALKLITEARLSTPKGGG